MIQKTVVDPIRIICKLVSLRHLSKANLIGTGRLISKNGINADMRHLENKFGEQLGIGGNLR